MLTRGDILDNTYQIVEEIGQGGAGVIYLAYHLRLRKKIVVKKIKDDFVGKINERSEVDVLKRLHHTYLPQVYDFLQVGREVFTIMDYIEGMDLDKYIARGTRFEEKQVLIWLRQLCEVLDYLHSQNPAIIHSDIKPSNIMVTMNGNICLIDFNISFGDDRSKGVTGFSERYASPEQILRSQRCLREDERRNVIVDGRSDIYSLGVTMYHLLTGIKPPEDYRRMIPISRLDVPYSPYLKNIIEKAMNPDIRLRYQSAKSMLGDLVNIKTRDKELQHLKLFRNVAYVVCGIMFLAGVVLTYSGMGKLNEEDFEDKYEEILSLQQSNAYEEVIAQGIKLLNNRKYSKVLGVNSVDKADVLYMVANSYFEQNDYSNAIEFYQEAISYNQGNPEYYRDYAIALARNRNFDEAQAVLEQATDAGMGTDHIYLVQAEIALGEDDFSSAIEYFEKAIHETNNDYLRSRAYILCARAYQEEGDYEKEIQILEQAGGNITSENELTVMKALAAAYSLAAGDTLDEAVRTQYNNAAIQCYETITSRTGADFNDYMNLAILYEAVDSYANAETQLLNMVEKYPNDYRVYMRLALVYCDMEQQKSDDAKNYTAIARYYEKAEQYYQDVRNSGKTDENMEYLESIIQELQEKGWL